MIPVRCPHCLACSTAVGDLFCPHCGAPLALLHIADGGQMILDCRASGMALPSVEMENRGVAPVQITFDLGLAHPASLAAQNPLVLPPFSGPVTIGFNVDVAVLRNQDNLRAAIPFTSTAGNLSRGQLLVAVSTPASVTVEAGPEGIDLGALPENGQATFTVPFSNKGNNRCSVSLAPQATGFILKVTVLDGEKGAFKLNGGETRKVSFSVLAQAGGPGTTTESLVFNATDLETGQYILDPIDNKLVGIPLKLSATVTATNQAPQVARTVDFGAVPPRLVVFREIDASCRGGVDGEILEAKIHDPCLKWMKPYFPRPVKNGEKTTFQLAFSTRWQDRVPAPPLPQDGHMAGFVAFCTGKDQMERAEWTFSDWRAQIQPPGIPQQIFAIDFGTVNSCVARFDGANLVAITDPAQPKGNGSAIIPSLMTFLDPEFFAMGERAQEYAKGGHPPERVIDSVKRALTGRARNIRAEEGVSYAPGDAVYGQVLRTACAGCNKEGRNTCGSADRDASWQAVKECNCGSFCGRAYLPVELASMMMEQLLLEAERCAGQRPAHVAMTVPANFTGVQRQAMINACRKARGSDEGTVVVIDEPTAAAMDYVFRQNGIFNANLGRHHILVFDFGGGTLDVCVVAVDCLPNGVLEVRPLAARGDNCMGGIDIDIEILRHMAGKAGNICPDFAADLIRMDKGEFEARFLQAKDTFSTNRRQWYREAKRCKEELCSAAGPNPKITFTAPPLLNINGGVVDKDKDHKIDLDYLTFNNIIQSRVDKAKALVESTLRAANIRPGDVNTLLATGQSSKISTFIEAVKSLLDSPHLAVPEVDKKTCVATGAAVAADRMVNAGTEFKVYNLDNTSYSYGFVRQNAFFQWKYQEMVPIGTTFSGAKGGLRLCLAELNENMWIGQNDDGSPGPFAQDNPSLTPLATFTRADVASALGFDYCRLTEEQMKMPIDLTLALEGESHMVELWARLPNNAAVAEESSVLALYPSNENLGIKVYCTYLNPEGAVYL